MATIDATTTMTAEICPTTDGETAPIVAQNGAGLIPTVRTRTGPTVELAVAGPRDAQETHRGVQFLGFHGRDYELPARIAPVR